MSSFQGRKNLVFREERGEALKQICNFLFQNKIQILLRLIESTIDVFSLKTLDEQQYIYICLRDHDNPPIWLLAVIPEHGCIFY